MHTTRISTPSSSSPWPSIHGKGSFFSTHGFVCLPSHIFTSSYPSRQCTTYSYPAIPLHISPVEHRRSECVPADGLLTEIVGSSVVSVIVALVCDKKPESTRCTACVHIECTKWLFSFRIYKDNDFSQFQTELSRTTLCTSLDSV